ncbi:MAG: bifunctional phosphopantothenoylcysteine decarboxylase/phosphopantothenate--cysteine ligase CoaBC [Methanosarcinaceae archaeon]|nr:bifunctional phosphopantothenoylcysteine decarboxylase/phosphopantothenate--cysteine ligase CoaBC [Methanosarcinaceae archaeon]
MNNDHEHPTLWIKENKSVSLSGKRIVLAVTGSIAAVRVVELARELIRNGADVHAVMTDAAKHILHPDALHYATGHDVISNITGDVEHVAFCGSLGCADLLLIAPATANTIGKIANGIDDTSVTTFATTALGSNIPVIVVPSMHGSMYDHPAVASNIDRLKEWGIVLIGPEMEEGVAKITSNDQIVLEVERILTTADLVGIKLLITSGATAEPIDPIRIITNRSSGKTGRHIALEAYRRGADVTIIHQGNLGIDGIHEIFVETAEEMIDATLDELENGYDIVISAAAISDYTIDTSSSKIKSGLDIVLELRPNRKLIHLVREAYPDMTLVGFKAEAGTNHDELIKRAGDTLEKSRLDLIVANEVSKGGIGTDDNDVYLIASGELPPQRVTGDKRLIACKLLDRVGEILDHKRTN